MSTARRSYLFAVPVIAEVIPSCGVRSPMCDVWKSLWGREPKGVASGRLLGSLLWGKGVCVGRGGGEWEGKIVLTVGLSLQNMSITQELCGYLTLNVMSDDNESVLKDTH